MTPVFWQGFTFGAGTVAVLAFAAAALISVSQRGWLREGRKALCQALWRGVWKTFLYLTYGTARAAGTLWRAPAAARRFLVERQTPPPTFAIVHVGATEDFGDTLHELVLEAATDLPPAALAEPGDPYAALAELAPPEPDPEPVLPTNWLETVRAWHDANRAAPSGKPRHLRVDPYLALTQEWRIVELAERQTAGVGA